MVPYNRGAFYFADLDARVRKNSQGKLIVLNLFKELRESKKNGKSHDLSEWRRIVLRRAGPDGEKALDAMLSGHTIFPIPGTFERCFNEKRSEIGKFDLLYKKVPGSNKIKSVKPDSNAARAGLKAGDQLTSNLYLKPYFSDPSRVLDVSIKRERVPMTISYVPRLGSVEARTWQKDPSRARTSTDINRFLDSSHLTNGYCRCHVRP